MAVWRRPVSQRRSIKKKATGVKKYQYRTSRPLTTYGNISPHRGIFGFGSAYRTKLRYCENIVLQSVSGGIGKNVFALNSLYDPNVTGTGHQPFYFDQLAAIFTKYTVYGAKIKVTFSCTTETAATSSFVVGVAGNTSTSFYTDPQTAMEDNHGKWTNVNGRNGNSGTRTLSLDFDPKRDLNLRPDQASLSSPVTADPVVIFYATCWISDLQSTGTTNCNISVEIVYDCEFSGNIATASS